MWKGQNSGIGSCAQSGFFGRLRTNDENRNTLAFSHDLSALKQIYIPDERLGRQAFDANFTLPPCARFADPHYAELGLILIVLNVEDLACPDWPDNSLQDGSPIADVSDLRMLREGHGPRVNAPDAYSKQRSDTSIATTIHRTSFSPTL